MFKYRYSARTGKRRGYVPLLVTLLCCLLLLCLGGCGSESRQPDQQAANSPDAVEGDSYGLASNIKVKTPVTLGNNNIANIKSGNASSPGSSADINRKIIQNARISLKVKNVSTAVDHILEFNQRNGGYTVTSHIYKNKYISADLSIKIPRTKLDSLLSDIAECGEVTDKVMNTEDVTEDYYDSKARMKVLLAKEERLLSLMNKASNVTDIISIENELSNTRSEIEVLTGRVKYLSNATDYSLVNIQLVQEVNGGVKAPQGTLGKSIQGLINSLNQMINLASSFVVLLFVLLPWVIILALLVLLIVYVYRRKKSSASPPAE